MNYKEVTGNLFSLNQVELFPNSQKEDYVLAHCIASDFGMYGGIAKQFVDIYDMKTKLFQLYKPDHSNANTGDTSLVGKALQVENVYNLITKRATYEMPSYIKLQESLQDLKTQMLAQNQCYLAIPMIGCGIDGLDWGTVNTIIFYVFENTNINILVVKKEVDTKC